MRKVLSNRLLAGATLVACITAGAVVVAQSPLAIDPVA